MIATDSGDGELKRRKIREQISTVLTQVPIFRVRELAIIVVRVLARGENV